MSHYRSNLRDLEFNLFELFRVQDAMGEGAFEAMDLDTAKLILREVERLAREEYADSFTESDRTPVELAEGEVVLPAGLKRSIDAYREGGWGRLSLQEELGGSGAPPSLHWSAVEMLVGANPAAYLYATGELIARVLWEEGNEQQKRLAEMMVDRDWGGTMMLTEPDAGSDVGAGTTKAIQVEGDVYHLEGVKRFITSGEFDHTDNIVHLVLARPAGAGMGTKGLSMFAVPKYLVGEDGELGERNGVYATNLEKKMGIKGSATCEMTFGLDRPCIGYLVGSRHDGIRQMFTVIEHARMLIGIKSASTLSTGYLNALEFARERVQGPDLAQAIDKSSPRVSIIHHPDVRRMLMIQKAYAEGLRSMWMYAASLQDRIVARSGDAETERLVDLLLPLVKGYSSEKAYELLALSLQVFGGSGFTQDYPIEQYIRDAKIDTLYEGTTGIQALDLFFRKIAKDQGETLTRVAAEIAEFVKGGRADDPIADERQALGQALDDAQAQLGVMVQHLVMYPQEPESIYKVGLHTNGLLESLAEVVIGWLLLRSAEVALEALEGDSEVEFYEGKVAAARFFVRDAFPRVAARRQRVEAEDGALMELAEDAF